MQLKDLGEFGFIESFTDKFSSLVPENMKGIGDDCAILPGGEYEDFLVTTDLLIEDIHFLKDEISAEELGYKSLAVNLSDLAAMGATPVSSFLSIGIPKSTDVNFLNGFMDGYYKLSNKYQVPLLGGDTTKSADRLVINVAVMGRCKKGTARLRSMAQAGDLICTTGKLGDSAGGLKVLLNQLERTQVHQQLIRTHHLPEPQIKEGQWLAERDSVHAMMDISDGIASDLKHILKASHVGAAIHLDELPISEELKTASKKNNWNATELAASGGEDYELLLTISPENINELQAEFESMFNKPLYVIGRIGEGKEEIQWLNKGIEVNLQKEGFDHFTN